MQRYKFANRRRVPRKLLWVGLFLIAVLAVATIYVRHWYSNNLQPVGNGHAAKMVRIASGSSVGVIGKQLYDVGLIRSASVFELYVTSHQDRGKLLAGSYEFTTGQSIPQIVNFLVEGKVATDMVTIYPGERLDQVKENFIKVGFTPPAVAQAFQPGQYRSTYPALSDNPPTATLEGFLYPDSFEKNASTDPSRIVEESLTEMQSHLTPEIRSAFAKEGLTTYQGVTLASMVEEEVSSLSDRPQVAQVFLKRLKSGMSLGSDVTAFYGAIAAGTKPVVTYDSPYNTLIHKGLPFGPIGAVSDGSLKAVAHPASTDWLYFVTGDNGKTYFSNTLEEHDAQVQAYCHKMCTN